MIDSEDADSDTILKVREGGGSGPTRNVHGSPHALGTLTKTSSNIAASSDKTGSRKRLL